MADTLLPGILELEAANANLRRDLAQAQRAVAERDLRAHDLEEQAFVLREALAELALLNAFDEAPIPPVPNRARRWAAAWAQAEELTRVEP